MIDFLIIFGLLAFLAHGWKVGIVRALGGFVGAVVGIFLASRWFEPLAQGPLGFVVGGNTPFGKVVAFFLIYFLVARFFAIAVGIADSVFKLVAWLPIVSGVQKFLGALVAFLEGVLVFAVLVYMSGKYPFSEGVAQALASSRLGSGMNGFVRLFEPLFPYWLQQLKSVFDAPAGAMKEYIEENWKF